MGDFENIFFLPWERQKFFLHLGHSNRQIGFLWNKQIKNNTRKGDNTAEAEGKSSRARQAWFSCPKQPSQGLSRSHCCLSAGEWFCVHAESDPEMGPCLNFCDQHSAQPLRGADTSPRAATIHITMRDALVCVWPKSPFVLSKNHGVIQPQGRLQPGDSQSRVWVPRTFPMPLPLKTTLG